MKAGFFDGFNFVSTKDKLLNLTYDDIEDSFQTMRKVYEKEGYELDN